MPKTCQRLHRPYSAVRLLVAVGLVVVASGPGIAGEPIALAGTVRDGVGSVLNGVEILLVRLPVSSLDPTRVTRSDPAGRFEIASVVPGRYRLAALKSGYRTFVGQVDAAASASLDVVLHPSGSLDPAAVPDDPAWALRVPRRGLLHDVDPDLGSPSAPQTRDDVDGALGVEVEQYFSLGSGETEGKPDDRELQASETRMTLGSSLGGHGSLRVEGRHQRLGSTSSQDQVETTARQQAASLNMDLSHDTGRDARLAVTGFFNGTDYELSGQAPTAPDTQLHERQTWGYDADWSKQLDSTRRVTVALGMQNTSLVTTLPSALQADPGDAVTQRTVAAEGSYASVVSQNHDVEMTLRAQMLRWPTADLEVPGVWADAESSSWLVQAEARDTWSVTGPLAVIYGLECRQALAAGEATLVVPQLGGVLSAGPWRASALLAYHSLVGSRDPGDSPAQFRPAERLGYEAEVQLPVARDVHLRGGVSYSPLQFDYVGYSPGSDRLAEHPIYLTDGNAEVREYRLTLVEQRGRSRTYVEAADGRAEGHVMALLSFEGPQPIGPGSRLQYRNGRLGVVFPGSGTDVRVQYEWVEAARQDSAGSAGTSLLEESVELRIKQSVSRLLLRGDWRFLMALRMGTVRSGDLVAWSSAGAQQPVDALNRRVSAGVSVVF